MNRAAVGLMCAVLSLLGCAVLSPSRRIFDQYARLEAGKVQTEISHWKELAAEDAAADDSVRAGADLRLALLYSHPDNPEPRFDLALEHLKRYAELDPDGARDGEIRRLRAILEDLARCVLRGEHRKEVSDLLWKERQEVNKRLVELRRDSQSMSQLVESLVEEELTLRRENEALKRRNGDLEKTSQSLTRQNTELRETIEQLKKLDLQMEQIRSGKGSP